MATTILRPSTHAEWLEARKRGIGSSEIGTICGLNPYETPYQLWRRKMGIDSPKEETFAMKAGHYLEDAVAQFWQDATGRTIIKSSAGDWLIRNDKKEFLQVSPDRTYWLSDKRNHEKGILECKTTQRTIADDDIPKAWFCQLQYQLGVAEMEQGSLAWLSAGRDFGYKDLAFVPDFYDWLCDEASRFWVDNVIGCKEPEVVNVADVLLKYSTHTADKTIECDDELFLEYSKLKQIREEIKRLEEHKENIENAIKMRMQDAEKISYSGMTLATWKRGKDSQKFNAKRFCACNPQLAEEFTELIPGSRRFILK